MWERFTEAVEATQGLFTTQDVEEAMRASNFNKGLGPDGFDGTILQPGNPAHRLTQTITGQILGLLGNPPEDPQVPVRGETGAPVQEQGQGPSRAQGHPTYCGEVPRREDHGESHHGLGGCRGPPPTADQDLPDRV